MQAEIPSSTFQTAALEQGKAIIGAMASYFHVLHERNEALEKIVRAVAECDPHYYQEKQEIMTCFFCGHAHSEDFSLEIQRTAHYPGCDWLKARKLMEEA